MINDGSKILLMTSFIILSACSGSGGTASNPSPSAESATVAGVDADHDGVRDDVNRYIAATYPNSAKSRSALMQYAKSVQTSFVNVSTARHAATLEPQLLRAGACVTATMGSATAITEIDARMANSPARVKARSNYEGYLEGKVFTIPSGDLATLCDVNPASLLN